LTLDSLSFTIYEITDPGIRANAIENKKATIEPIPAFWPVLFAFVRDSP